MKKLLLIVLTSLLLFYFFPYAKGEATSRTFSCPLGKQIMVDLNTKRPGGLYSWTSNYEGSWGGEGGTNSDKFIRAEIKDSKTINCYYKSHILFFKPLSQVSMNIDPTIETCTFSNKKTTCTGNDCKIVCTRIK